MIKNIVKEHIWLIACDIICLFTGIVLIYTSIESREIVWGGIFVALSWILALWIGVRIGGKIAEKRAEREKEQV